MNTENQQINLHVEKGANEVIIRHGQAEPVVPFRTSIDVSGTLEVPRKHLENPPMWLTASGPGEIDAPLNHSYVKVDRAKGGIRFFQDVGTPWESSYEGILRLDPRFEKFGINTGRSYTTLELANFIKMNRSHFETKDKAMLLVTELRQFKAKIDKDVENQADDRGNRKILMAQAVESNIPESFMITVPVFKGYAVQALEVEIAIDPGDLSCTLVSPEVNDYVEGTKDDLINAEIEQIKDLHPTLRIFEA